MTNEESILKEKKYIPTKPNPTLEKKSKKYGKKVAKAFKPAELTENIVFLEDTKLKIEELKAKQESLTGEELEKNKKAIESYQSGWGDYFFSFHLNSPLKKLNWKDGRFESKEILWKVMWTGILDFPVEHPFIFGRVANRVRHKGGSYLFASIADIIDPFLELIREYLTRYPEFKPRDIIDHLPFVELLNKSLLLGLLRERMKYALHLKNNKQLTNIEFIDKMNQDRKLVNQLKKNKPYGTIETSNGIEKHFMMSDVDINTICIPYDDFSIIHMFEIPDYLLSTKMLPVMKNLVDYLSS